MPPSSRHHRTRTLRAPSSRHHRTPSRSVNPVISTPPHRLYGREHALERYQLPPDGRLAQIRSSLHGTVLPGPTFHRGFPCRKARSLHVLPARSVAPSSRHHRTRTLCGSVISTPPHLLYGIVHALERYQLPPDGRLARIRNSLHGTVLPRPTFHRGFPCRNARSLLVLPARSVPPEISPSIALCHKRRQVASR